MMEIPVERTRPVTPLFRRQRKEGAHRVELAAGSFRIPARLAPGLGRARDWAISLDLVKKEIRTPGVTVDLRAKERLCSLLTVMLRSRGRGVPLQELFERAWGMRWKCADTHGPVVTYSLHRLRTLFRDLGAPRLLSLIPGEGYSLRLGADHVAILPETQAPSRRELTGLTPEAMVHALIARHGFVNNRLMRTELGWSRSYANRLVLTMVAGGSLLGRGRGRAVHYVAA